MRCGDCGSLIRGGYCTYCQEEAYILEYQWQHIDRPPSDEFFEKAMDQIKSKERYLETNE